MLYYRMMNVAFCPRLFVKDSASVIVSNGTGKPGYFSNNLHSQFCCQTKLKGCFLSVTLLAKSMFRIVFVSATLHKVELDYIFF